jgi:hypothetical protein
LKPFVLCGALVVGLACVITPSSPGYTVSYQLTKTPEGSGLRCDSVLYQTAQGQIIKVINPALPWSIAVSVPAGSSIQAAAWIVATGGGQTAKLRMTWTVPGVSTAADSSFGTSTAPGAFMLGVSRLL